MNFKKEDYEAFKKFALEKAIIRKIVSVSDIDLINKSTIKWQGNPFIITEAAFKQFIKLLGLSLAQNENIETLLGEKYMSQLITMMKAALATHDNKHKICMLIDKISAKVVGFTDQQHIILSNESYLKIFEDVMNNNPGLQIKNMAITEGGNIEISTINSNWEFNVSKLKNEFFKGGLVFLNTPNNMVVNPYCERLICTNGAVISQKGFAITLASTDEKHFKGFFDKLMSIKNITNAEDAFKDRVVKMMQTSASLSEAYSVRKSIEEHVGNSEFDRDTKNTIEYFVPTKWLEEQFKAKGHDVTTMDRKLLTKVRTNLSVWELVNRLTDISSNAAKHGVFLKHGSQSVLGLQREAGDLMFKKNYDLEEPFPQLFKAPVTDQSNID